MAAAWRGAGEVEKPPKHLKNLRRLNMPNSYDCSRNALSERAASQRAEQAVNASLLRQFRSLENRVAELETWQEREQEAAVGDDA